MVKYIIDNLLQSLGSLRWLLRASVATVYLRAAGLLCASPQHLCQKASGDLPQMEGGSQ